MRRGYADTQVGQIHYMMGPDGEMEPSNAKVELQSCDVLYVADGRVTGGRSYFDLNTVTRQVKPD